jgi:hypothetical protein
MLSASETRKLSLGWSVLGAAIKLGAERKAARANAKSKSKSNLNLNKAAGHVAAMPVDDESVKCKIALKRLGSLQSDLRCYQDCCEKAGFTRADRGFTGHSFRHSFAHSELEANGFVAVIKSRSTEVIGMIDKSTGLAVAIDKKHELEVAKYNVSRALGHSRVSVTSSYYGSNRALPRRGEKTDVTDQHTTETSPDRDGGEVEET